ncbi:MAG TPA: type II toxin-antitoxin system HicA family toxin [Longimicrobium sp.]|nr:type II toxin-antitoxin system HicA family toxin [Longimicrobium sp.]
MSKAAKRLAALRASQTGWRYHELAGILQSYGFTTDEKGGGSHRIWKHPSGVRVGLVDSGSGTLLPAYAREVLKALDSLSKPEEGAQ